jgi:hypothetical protein
MHVFSSNIFFGRFSAAFGQKRRPYGRQFFSANNFFLGPVLSYFAEFSAGWQQCVLLIFTTPLPPPAPNYLIP